MTTRSSHDPTLVRTEAQNLAKNCTEAASPPEDVAAWDRRRLLVVLVGVAAASVLLVAGLGYTGWRVIAGPGGVENVTITGDWSGVSAVEAESSQHDQPHDQSQDGTQDGARGQEYRDRAAAAPMLEVPPAAATPPTSGAAGMLGPASAASAAGEAAVPGVGRVAVDSAMAVPTGVEMGPATVMTGFPRTPEGAVGQLAQIEVSVLQAMSLPVTAEVHAAWALPGAVTVQQWALSAHVASFLAATTDSNTAATGAGGAGAVGVVVKDPAISVTVTPVAGLIKATDGPDWVVACVLSTVSAVYQQHRETSLGHCEPMQWAGGRWLIAPGPPPAPAPSTWPGTEAAAAAGWRPWSGAPDIGADAGP